MRAGPRLILAAIHSAADRIVTVVIENQVGMAAGAIEPVLYPALRLRNGCADGAFGSLAIGVGRRSGDVFFALQAVAQLLLGLSDVLAENVSAGTLVLAEVAAWIAA